MPGSIQISVSSFFLFGDLGCVIFFTMVSVCKARQARLFKNVNKHCRDFDGQNQQKLKSENGIKAQKGLVEAQTGNNSHYSYYCVKNINFRSVISLEK
jgi:hypothetical protein